MPRSALPERTSSSSAPTSGATWYSVAIFSFCAMLFHSSMLKPVRRPCSSITIGGSTRVATRTLRGGSSASDAGTANASSSPLMQSLTMWRMRSPDPASEVLMLGLLPVILGISDAAYTGLTGWPRLRRLAGAERPEGREEGSAGAKRPPSSLQVPAAFRRPRRWTCQQVEGAEHIRERGFGPARAAAKRGRAHRFWGPRPAAGALGRLRAPPLATGCRASIAGVARASHTCPGSLRELTSRKRGKLRGFYADDTREHHSLYTVETHGLTKEDKNRGCNWFDLNMSSSSRRILKRAYFTFRRSSGRRAIVASVVVELKYCDPIA